jgi:xanthine dehydrogenase YagS FAD-binding subunit
VSVAAALEVSDGVVTGARLAFGGVGTKPWRARRAEAALIGGPADETSFRLATALELEPADVREHNALRSTPWRSRPRAASGRANPSTGSRFRGRSGSG